VRTPISFISVSSSPAGDVQRWPGWMTTCGGRARLVGDGVRLRPARDRDVAVAHSHGLAAVRRDEGLAADDRDQRERRLVLDPQRPRRVHARAQEEGVACPRSDEQPGDRIHAVDDRT
jgi:hypothetical protein